MQRYSETIETIRHNDVGKLRYETMLYPDFPPKITDKYIIARVFKNDETIVVKYLRLNKQSL
jgi:hypothetical protein